MMTTIPMNGTTGATMDQLTEGLRNGVVGIPPEAAVGAIIHWETLLAQSGDAEMQVMATDLATLRGALTADTLDGFTIGEILQSLGNRLHNLSGSVDSGAVDSLLEFGDLLNQEGARLGGGRDALSDNGSGMSGRQMGYENTGPEVSSGSLTTGASFTSGSPTMSTQVLGQDASDIADSDSEQTGRTGSGI